MTKIFSSTITGVLLCICWLCPLAVNGADYSGLSKGQVLYVPAYSHIYSGNKEKPFLLTVTLSVRNIDPKNPIRLMLVDYYETQGKLLKQYVFEPVQLKPLDSQRYIIAEKDESGGSGANFLVEWQSDIPVNPPIVESIMIGAQFQQGISFTSRAREILETK